MSGTWIKALKIALFRAMTSENRLIYTEKIYKITRKGINDINMLNYSESSNCYSSKQEIPQVFSVSDEYSTLFNSSPFQDFLATPF